MEFIECLKKFSAKERFILLENVLLENREDKFRLSKVFRTKLEKEIEEKLEIKLHIPREADFIAIDYHINWLYASLVLSHDQFTEIQPEKIINLEAFDNPYGIIEGNQEDVDLVLCWKENERYKLILIEAKATTSWTTKQIKRKAERLGKFFAADKKNWSNIDVFFIFTSPQKPKKLKLAGDELGKMQTHEWLCNKNKEILWVKLIIEPEILTVTRCHKEQSKTSKEGLYWKVEKRK